MFPFYNEEGKLAAMAPRLRAGLVDKFVGVNDGSTDRGPRILREHGIEVLDIPHTGAGACIKHAVRHAQDHGYDILVVMAGNNKDDPEEIPRLLEPILREGCDYVQGSRFLSGGGYPNLPKFRLFAIKLLSLLFSAYAGRRCTELTNGFRAYRLSLFSDPRIDIWQEWLDGYEYEYYVHWKVYTYGYRVKEVPVTKSYPADKTVQYSKIPPFTGWWHMLRPFVLLTLRLKR
jgi:dolichol-phosphate mannosyltransferase